jgi:hypothetical protein
MLNWTYAPDLHARQVPYKFFDLTLRLGTDYAGLPELEKDLPVEHNHRGTFFRTTTSHMLAVHYNPPGCLKLLGPGDALLPGLPGRLPDALPVTQPGQVKGDGPNTARPPVQLGPEPAHDWCYYYQKAGLARQQGDWAEVAALGDRAFEAGYTWHDPAELLPFVEGYARAGRSEQARSLSAQAGSQDDLRPVLCAVWKGIAENPAGMTQDAMAAVQSELGCRP